MKRELNYQELHVASIYRKKADLAHCLQMMNNCLQLGTAEAVITHSRSFQRRSEASLRGLLRHLFLLVSCARLSRSYSAFEFTVNSCIVVYPKTDQSTAPGAHTGRELAPVPSYLNTSRPATTYHQECSAVPDGVWKLCIRDEKRRDLFAVQQLHKFVDPWIHDRLSDQ